MTTLRLDPTPATSEAIVAGLAFSLNGRHERAIEVLERARAAAPLVTRSTRPGGRLRARRAAGRRPRVGGGGLAARAHPQRRVLAHHLRPFSRRARPGRRPGRAACRRACRNGPSGSAATTSRGLAGPRSPVSPSATPGRAALELASRHCSSSARTARPRTASRARSRSAPPSSLGHAVRAQRNRAVRAGPAAGRSTTEGRHGWRAAPTPTSTPRRCSTSRRWGSLAGRFLSCTAPASAAPGPLASWPRPWRQARRAGPRTRWRSPCRS